MRFEPENPHRSLPFLVVSSAAVATLLFGGCSDGESSAVVATLGPPAIGIASPKPGACVVLGDDADRTVRVHIEIENWSLRPQGFCGGIYKQCGYATFLVDGQELVRSASLVTDVSFGRLPSPPGAHRIRVELRGDDDVVQLDEEGEPLAAEVDVSTANTSDGCP